MKTTLMAAAAVLTLGVGAAQAELVRRDEAGTATYALAAPAGLDGVREAAPGETVWTESLTPASAVRIMVDAPTRNQRGQSTPGPAAGTILYAYAMEGGQSYCQKGLPENGRRVQCFRDFDADGDFDASYVTIPLERTFQLLVGRLTGLTPIAQLAYEQLTGAEMPQVAADVAFDGWRGSTARFVVRTGEEELTQLECRPAADGTCAVLGLTLRVERGEGGGARVSLMGTDETRQLRLDFT